ncbi:MAG TPA: EamA family transporter RarD [Burkholderiaceae bacterium]|nr:EamA family transporter RarD [Burkholderiaceae bacterium]
MNRGIAYAAAAYILWGLFPVYFKALQSVPALEILAHRMAWSLAFCALLLVATRRWTWVGDVVRKPRLLSTFVASSAIVSFNWGLYIWAVNAGHIVDASLGYFINPLVSVLFGALLLHERLRPVQWMAVGIAALGVAWLTVEAGALPWIGLALALSFGTYGLLRKTAPLGALEGLTAETTLLFPLAFGYLAWLAAQGENAFLAASPSTQWLLAAAGPVTAVPLLLFAAGARRIPLYLLGLLQYFGPSLQLIIGVWLYGEPFTATRAIGFGMIWLALVVFTLEGVLQSRRRENLVTARAAD